MTFLPKSKFWDLLKGGYEAWRGRLLPAIKLTAKSGAKLLASDKDKILSAIYTDPEFQRILLEVVTDSKKFKPSYKPVEKLAKLLKEKGISISEIAKKKED